MKETSGNDGKYKVVSDCCRADTEWDWDKITQCVVWLCTQCGFGCKTLIVTVKKEAQ